MWIEPLVVVLLVVLVSWPLALALRRLGRPARIGVSVAAAAIVVLPLVWHVMRARWQLIGDTFDGVRTSEKIVALTFDDGPTREWTGAILATLARERVRATFFLIGESVDANADETRAIIAAGHEVGNHSYTHTRMILCSPGFVRGEIERTDAALRRAGWQGPLLFRSPFCKKFLVLPFYLARHERTNVFWDVEADAYGRHAISPARYSAAVVAAVRGGSVVLMHPMYDSGQATRDALPGIIHGLRDRGFEFLTVSELMRRRPMR